MFHATTGLEISNCTTPWHADVLTVFPPTAAYNPHHADGFYPGHELPPVTFKKDHIRMAKFSASPTLIQDEATTEVFEFPGGTVFAVADDDAPEGEPDLDELDEDELDDDDDEDFDDGYDDDDDDDFDDDEIDEDLDEDDDEIDDDMDCDADE